MLLEVKNLKIKFIHDKNETEAVHGISFTIKENEILGIVGESGSGKTVTALSIMKLLLESNSSVEGEVIFRDKNVLTLHEKEILKVRGSEIAMVFQEPFTSLNPVLRVGEQIEEAILAHRKISKKDAKVETLTLLEKVKIKNKDRIYSSYPHLLSGGERQRIMIAMAIALKPKLLIADEPTTALDVTIQSEILDLILGLRRELGMSVLFITHDFGIIKKVAERVLVMKEGNVVESGTKEEVLSSPGEEYTKKLIEAVPKINLKQDIPKDSSGKDAIVISGLSKTFSVEKGIFSKKSEKVAAVSNVNLKIKEGRTLGLVGESGSGKTTLGKLILGLLNADRGKVENKIGNNSIQIVFQDPHSSLDPRIKMGDVVLEGPTIQGVSKEEKEKILRDVLFKVHLSYKDRFKYPHQFSGGERQRIAIARSLAVKPRILILDEPVSSLDVIIQSEILQLLKILQRELSLTYVFISHDLRVVEYMAEEVAVMRDGKIIEFAKSREIYSSPKEEYTKRLLRSVLTL